MEPAFSPLDGGCACGGDEFVTAVASSAREERCSVRRTRQGGGLTGVDRLEVRPDDLERQVLVTLHREHHGDALDIGGGELAIPCCRARRSDEALLFEEPQLRRGELWELGLKEREHLADPEQLGLAARVRGGGGARH